MIEHFIPSPMQNHYFECSCQSEEHTIRFCYDPDDGGLYLSTFLEYPNSRWARVWMAIKYVFGYTSKFGHFECTILQSCDLDRLNFMITAARQKQGESLAQGVGPTPSQGKE